MVSTSCIIIWNFMIISLKFSIINVCTAIFSRLLRFVLIGETMEPTPLRDFLEIPYEKLEEMNLEVKQARTSRTPVDRLQEQRVKYLTDEKRIKAVTVCFSDLEGRL